MVVVQEKERPHMQSRSLMVLRLATAPTEEVGATPHGRLSIFPIIGGSFEG
jgi:hypothetical protein